MIHIDGATGEGGGQILRTALALSTLTGKPFSMTNIRKGRCNPGLKHEHLCCIEALQKMSNAIAEHAGLGSTELAFTPGRVKPGTYSLDIVTAGSITLVLQALLLPCIFSQGKTRIRIKGGTDVKWSQPIDYFQHVFLPYLRKFADVELLLELRGYYPKGGGRVDVKIKPKEGCTFDAIENKNCILQPFNNLSQGNLLLIKGISHASQELEQSQVAERQATAARQALSVQHVPVDIRKEYQKTLSPGSGIMLYALFSHDQELDLDNPIIIGADALGEKSKRAEDVGKEAADRLLQEIRKHAPIDEYLADNLIPFLALAGGNLHVSKLSHHTITNIGIVEMFLGKTFHVDEEKRIISAEKANLLKEAM